MADKQSELSRRTFLKMTGAAAGMLLPSCTAPGSGTSTTRRSEPVQLVYQDWRTDWFPALAQRMIDEFHEQQPNIRVFYTPEPDNMVDKMLTDMEMETAPDVFSGCCEYFPGWAQKGYLLDLRRYVEADLDKETIEDWDPAQYRAFFTRDQQQFGLPKYHGALALYYNKDLFDEYDVPYPNDSWDHEDYYRAMQQLTRDRDGDGKKDLWGSMIDVTWDRVQIHVNGWGGHFVDPEDDTKCRMAEPPALAAMEWLRACMWDDQVMARLRDVDYLETRHAFIQQRIAMVEDGSWALKDILAGADFRVGVAPFPAGPERRVTLATTDGWGIYAGTRHPEAAWELMKFLTSHPYGREMARVHFLQPARASLVDEWIGFIQDEFPEKAKQVDLGAFAEGHIKGYSVTAEIFAKMTGARRIVDNAWDSIYTEGEAPVESMKNSCQEIERILQSSESSPILHA